jgi:hypothetical protein
MNNVTRDLRDTEFLDGFAPGQNSADLPRHFWLRDRNANHSSVSARLSKRQLLLGNDTMHFSDSFFPMLPFCWRSVLGAALVSSPSPKFGHAQRPDQGQDRGVEGRQPISGEAVRKEIE